MDIAVIGAGGLVGRQIVQTIISDRLLENDQRLILVGNPEGSSAKSVFGFAVDLTDAYAEVCPQIEVTLTPEEIKADLIVMAGGATIPVDSQTGRIGRDYLAEKNAPIFERYASALAKYGHRNEIVIEAFLHSFLSDLTASSLEPHFRLHVQEILDICEKRIHI